jgi:peptidoglycan/xylan/chitin deacetylase (PgdA/CDA1 family)
MSRFWITTALAIPIFCAIGYFLHGWPRILAYTLFWIVWLTIMILGIVYVRMNFFSRAICRGNTSERVVALTFDDGPDAQSTPALLDLLRDARVLATFFCIGKQVEAHPEIAARIVAEGHLIANHTFNHRRDSALMLPRRLKREILEAQAAIERATGVRPALFRPPMGMTNPHFPRALRETGMTLVGWDVRSLDTRFSADEVVPRIARLSQPGSIVLLHDGGLPAKKVLEIAQRTIHALRECGYSFVRLDELITPPGNRSPRSARPPADEDRARDECPDPAGDRRC